MKPTSPRILPITEEKATPETIDAYQYHTSTYHGRITNMKSTLGHSPIAFEAYMQWYPLYEEVKKILGDRLSPLYAWSISEASDCPLCSTYFRKTIIEAGENPENLILSHTEQQLLSFGAAIALNKGLLPDEIYHSVALRYSDKEMVTLIAFAGIMIATNIFNNVIHTEIDEYLHPFLSKQ